jgi:imidazolonepropionase-like amidohydrolase
MQMSRIRLADKLTPRIPRRLLLTLPIALTLILPLCYSSASAQNPPPSKPIAIRAGQLIDGKGGSPISNALILVDNGKIVSITTNAAPPPADAQLIDLSSATVLPGLIDAHTHIFLQGDPTAGDYADQLLKDSIPYRAILAARNARIALDHGFTTLRDLETEGAMYADVDVKKAIERGEIPGARLFVATRALSSTGTYPLLGYSWELDLPHGVQIVDGVENARLAVRQQIGNGADWIKFYADHDVHFTPDGLLHSTVNFTDDEARAIVDEAHRLGHPVAAHAVGIEGIDAALKAGVNSVEHGVAFNDALLDRAKAQGVYWIPTAMTIAHATADGHTDNSPIQNTQKAAFSKALQKGVKIVFGTDAGGFSWQKKNEAIEFMLYVDYGMSPMQAIQTATSSAAQLLGWSDRLGAIEPGKIADIVAVPGDPLADIRQLQNVQFVMKAGIVYRNDLK